MRYLDEFYDEALDTSGATKESIQSEEIERLGSFTVLAGLIVRHPKRLGGDATREELAADNKRANRTRHTASQFLWAWLGVGEGYTYPEADEEMQREAAQLDWQNWYDEYKVHLIGRIRYVATFAKKSGDITWGNKAVLRLQNEMDGMKYSMRD